MFAVIANAAFAARQLRDGPFTPEDPVKMHASFGITAWCYLLPVALIAKAGGQLQSDPSTRKALFFIHYFFALLAVAFTIVAVTIANLRFGETENGGAHPGLAYALLALCLLASIFGHFAPAKDASWRPIFNILHRCIALCVVAVAIATVFVGVEKYETFHDETQAHRMLLAAAIGTGVLYGIYLILGTAVLFKDCSQWGHEGKRDIADKVEEEAAQK